MRIYPDVTYYRCNKDYFYSVFTPVIILSDNVPYYYNKVPISELIYVTQASFPIFCSVYNDIIVSQYSTAPVINHLYSDGKLENLK